MGRQAPPTAARTKPLPREARAQAERHRRGAGTDMAGPITRAPAPKHANRSAQRRQRDRQKQDRAHRASQYSDRPRSSSPITRTDLVRRASATTWWRGWDRDVGRRRQELVRPRPRRGRDRNRRPCAHSFRLILPTRHSALQESALGNASQMRETKSRMSRGGEAPAVFRTLWWWPTGPS